MTLNARDRTELLAALQRGLDLADDADNPTETSEVLLAALTPLLDAWSARPQLVTVDALWEDPPTAGIADLLRPPVPQLFGFVAHVVAADGTAVRLHCPPIRPLPTSSELVTVWMPGSVGNPAERLLNDTPHPTTVRL